VAEQPALARPQLTFESTVTLTYPEGGAATDVPLVRVSTPQLTFESTEYPYLPGGGAATELPLVRVSTRRYKSIAERMYQLNR
jgi:hypothetical protein